MTAAPWPLKLSGLPAPGDIRHQPVEAASNALLSETHYFVPQWVDVQITTPSRKTIRIPQYADTVVGDSAGRYDPAGDCRGYFMSYLQQPNNNCYAYGCNIASNTFPQPGRHSGCLLTAADMQQPFDALGQLVSGYAVQDGLVMVGSTWEALMAFKSQHQGTNPHALGTGHLDGHFVALMVSPADPNSTWTGDYHWARCDTSSGDCRSWSQKDGSDQVTNFDFAGQPITNPMQANWQVNQGPVNPQTQDYRDMVVSYDFYGFMFVPASGVQII